MICNTSIDLVLTISYSSLQPPNATPPSLHPKRRRYLVRPRARHARVLLHAPAQLDIFMRSEQVLQAVFDVRHDPGQRLAAHDDTWTAHAEILVVLQAEQPELLLIAAARLADEHRLAAVYGPEQRGQPVGAHVHIVVRAHKPLVRVAVIVPHVLQHQERLFLRRVRVIHCGQPDQRQVGQTRWPGRRLRAVEQHATGYAARPRSVHSGRPGGQISVRGHHTDQQQRFGWTNVRGTVVGASVWCPRPLVTAVVVQPPKGRPGRRPTAAGKRPAEPIVRAERVSDQQAQRDAGQHVR